MNDNTLKQLLTQCDTEELMQELKTRGALQVRTKAEEIETAIKKERLKALQKANEERNESRIIKVFLFLIVVLIYAIFIYLCWRYLCNIAVHYERPF